MYIRLLFAIHLFAIVNTACGMNFYVPYGPGISFPNIQSAIDAAIDGDVIIIRPGRYYGAGNHDIDFLGKAITVRGENPNNPNVVENTRIDCFGETGQNRRGFIFQSGETRDSVLTGLTIINGYVESQSGGGIACYSSSPTIRSCKIISCQMDGAAGGGGGLYVMNADPLIDNCIFFNNYSKKNGGGIYFENSQTTLLNSIVKQNTSINHGGGIYAIGKKITLHNVLLHLNTAYHGNGAGIYADECELNFVTATENGTFASVGGDAVYINSESGSEIKNSIIWDNPNRDGKEGEELTGSADVSYTNIKQCCPGQGNINKNPLFVQGVRGRQFYLSQKKAGQGVNSPCLNAASDLAINLGIHTHATRNDQYHDIAKADMGFHYISPLPVVLPEPEDFNADLETNMKDFVLMAQNWNGRPAFAIQEDVVQVDGNLSEWRQGTQWNPLNEIYFGEPIDLDQAEYAVKWCRDTNKIYVAVRVQDFDHQFIDSYTNWDASDRIELYTQGNNRGGQGWYGIYDKAQQYMVGPNNLGGFWATWALGDGIEENLSFDFSVNIRGDEIVYEVGLPLFEDYGGFKNQPTFETELVSGRIIRFDVIANSRRKNGFGMRSENLKTSKHKNADQFSKYILANGSDCGDYSVVDLDDDCLLTNQDVNQVLSGWLEIPE